MNHNTKSWEKTPSPNRSDDPTQTSPFLPYWASSSKTLTLTLSGINCPLSINQDFIKSPFPTSSHSHVLTSGLIVLPYRVLKQGKQSLPMSFWKKFFCCPCSSKYFKNSKKSEKSQQISSIFSD